MGAVPLLNDGTSLRKEHTLAGLGSSAFPRLRWIAVAWLCVWTPTYAMIWGWPNFLRLCDVAVILTAVGFWRGSPLLLSSQAVSSLIADLAWSLDVGWRLVAGHHLFGGTEYMWDARVALWVRLLSLFHVALPVLLVWSLGKVGYDRRGLGLQSAIAALLLVVSRFFGPGLNYNYAFTDPLFHRAWGPAPLHLAVIVAGVIALTYLPAHWVFARLFPSPEAVAQRRSEAAN